MQAPDMKGMWIVITFLGIMCGIAGCILLELLRYIFSHLTWI